ncbi:DNA cytosine methyltransferase [Ralstonia pseudosolanacearum]|uniref:DNA (cytosine-5-)-methyltransferase n=1 Tax=Ralstonia solanacearum TaxID=305 RepID=A0AA92QB26_RALSL|nr:DNA cytosine methyltransferase [Ralstonia pseudosolanacearum]QOK96553.1 DNA cytosine methyltransferase [Ralstonia pseudosolanacearum]
MIRDQLLLGIENELIVDLFAGGGGMSTAIEMALGRHVDIAINHDPDAIEMHKANHPQTKHYCSDVFEVCPREATQGRPVGHLHGSPDCTHFSQAKGGQARSRKIRALAWVMVRWAGQVKPRSFSMENVHQMKTWGRLIAKRDKATGRVVTLEMVKCPQTGKLANRVAAPGERVPVHEQFLVPDPKHAGKTWRRFARIFESMGYDLKVGSLVACDHGAGTTRDRLFVFGRRDGLPIHWPQPTHMKNPAKGQKKVVSAADNIDWNIPCPSIFDRKKPLAEATMRRIAKGMKKFVLDSTAPFIVPVTHQGGDRVHDIRDPLRTITAAHRGELALCAPHLVKFRGDHIGHPVTEPCPTITSGGGAKRPAGAAHALGLAAASLIQLGYGEREGQAPRVLDLREPLGTVVAGGIKHGLSTAFLAQANGGFNTTPGHDVRDPVSTITNTGSQQQLVTANLVTLRRNCAARAAEEPVATITAGAEHHSLVEYRLSREHEEGALRCAAFLISYYGTDNMRGLDEPLATITTRDRLALVTVWIKGEAWVVVDIGLRMLTPRELYNCQGFPHGYIIDRGADGRVFSKSAQVKMVGNSVSPRPGKALISLNCMDLAAWTTPELGRAEAMAA